MAVAAAASILSAPETVGTQTRVGAGSIAVGKSTLTRSAGSLGRNTELEIEPAFGRKFVLNARRTDTHNSFVGIDLIEQTDEAGVGLDYLRNRHMILADRVQHLRFIAMNAGDNDIARTLTISVKGAAMTEMPFGSRSWTLWRPSPMAARKA